MIREDDYRAFVERLNARENANLKKNLPLKPKGHDLTFHIGRIEAYINAQDNVRSETKKLLELDYSVSLTKVKEMMDEQGWK